MDYTVPGVLQARILEWVSLSLLQGIFPTQGQNPGFLHCRQILYQLSHQGSPKDYESPQINCCCCCQSCLTLQPHGLQQSGILSFTISQSLLKLMCVELVMPSNSLILCHPLLLLTSILPSIRVFSDESALCIRYQCQSIGASALVLPMNIQGCFPLGLTGLISMLSKGLSRVLSSTAV